MYTSIRTTVEDKGIDFISGSMEWADYDATATTNAIALLDQAHNLPKKALNLIFENHIENFYKRRWGEDDRINYSAYEIRIIAALVRLDWRENSIELLNYYLTERRPLAWDQWPEIT